MEFIISGKPVRYSVEERAGGNARITFRWDGKQRHITTEVRRKRDVTKREAARLLQGWIDAEGTRTGTVPNPATGLPFLEAVRRHLEHAHAANTPDSLKGARATLLRLGEALGMPTIEAVDKEAFRAVEDQLKRGRAAKTWANELGEYRHFARWLVDEDLLLRDFTRGAKRPSRDEFGTREAIYDEAWFAPLREALPLEWRPVWEDFWFTGMDGKDLWEFEPLRDMIMAADGSWKIWKKRSKEKIFIDQPLSSMIRARWIARRAECHAGDRLHTNAARYANARSWGHQFRKALNRAQHACGLPQLDVKTTRHTFATRHLLRLIRGEKNAPHLDQIRRWLGHAPDSRMLERVYAKLSALPHLMD